MSGISIKISTEDLGGVGPRLAQLVSGLKDRSGLHEGMERRIVNLTRDHLIDIAQTRHDTARKLGASPTGHWAQAAEKTTGTHDGEGVTLTVNQPGISRAGGDVTIKPGAGKKFLTIPMIAAAYGQRAYRVPGLFVLKGVNSLSLAKEENGKLSIWYALVSSVTQKQDRTLLPSDDEYKVAALEGVSDYVSYLMSRKGGTATT